ncbi:sugar transferase [Geodermatophilus ruber]|uniref:Exopolysaccharide biosynthesis polyprenyl glycosylphosphotransferase n=1 Tax=Geodermatophilus ruber TaxID=504800 RepID=A0A1I4DGR7_9ACTN|nr:sugar transferase [Geodermatophilus ruber]SFK92273.1 exopolysaccharide biosynthesis polyprenyl glycosylphosphotransferase [Geodermatophilus ruber]
MSAAPPAGGVLPPESTPQIRRRRVWAAALLATDFAAAALAFVAVPGVRWEVAGVFFAIAAALLAAGRLYRSRLYLSVLDDLPAMVGRSIVAGALTTAVGVVGNEWASRSILFFTGAFVLLQVITRSVAFAVARRARKARRVRHRTLIMGGGQVAGLLARTLIDRPETGLEPIGFLDDDPLLSLDWPVPHLGGNADLVDVVREHGVDHIVVAFGSAREASIVDVLRACDRLACEILFVPRFYEVHSTDRDMEIAWGIPLVRMRRAPFRSASWRMKRLLDIVFSAAAIAFLAPVLGICALAVRISVGSPILFRQERVGLDGRPFTLLKFTSLRPVDAAESAQNWNIAHDDRLTAVGKVLRRTSLDELPQLWNILRGDMSLVGPRPERPHFVNEFTRQFPQYMARHRVPAGLTGTAQVHGLRGDTSIADRARFDNYYIENWSFWGDIKILLRTISQVLGAAGR